MMTLIYRLLSIAAFVVFIAGCSTQYPYTPTHSIGHGNFSEKVGDNLYRVHHKILINSPTQAQQLAVSHARSLTRDMQLDWFVIVQQQLVTEVLIDPHNNTVQRNQCSQQNCQQSSYQNPYFKTQFKSRDDAATTEAILHIRMGKGLRPDDVQSYDAHTST
ncbi:CC0125/CC1285 family lipoprotein [Kangiella marina]|uniref:Lipoprotein n=1 Tax=Kangiella marina TaxID=1079178 RepID=A0ABP8IJC2_9GAMM